MTVGALPSNQPVPISETGGYASFQAASGTLALATGYQIIPGLGIGNVADIAYPAGRYLVMAQIAFHASNANHLLLGQIVIGSTAVSLATHTATQVNSGSQFLWTAFAMTMPTVAANTSIYVQAKNNNANAGNVGADTTLLVLPLG